MESWDEQFALRTCQRGHLHLCQVTRLSCLARDAAMLNSLVVSNSGSGLATSHLAALQTLSMYGDQGYEEKWRRGVRPGTMFDAARTEPALVKLVRSGSLGASTTSSSQDTGERTRSVLVPGCGRGYALVTFAEAGFDVTGIDLAPTAIREARRHIRDLGISTGGIQVLQQDFFSADLSYDLAYDSTFLCALPPKLRDAWAEQYERLIRQGGELITLIWPLPGSQKEEHGPPFVISLALLRELLAPRGFELVAADVVEDEDWARPKRGGEIIARWRKL